jgi:hypothetical protein
VWPAPKHGRGGSDSWAPAIVPGGVDHSHASPNHSPGVQIPEIGPTNPNLKFKLVETSLAQKRPSRAPKIWKNMVLKISKRWTTISIETSLDPESILNENLEDF